MGVVTGEPSLVPEGAVSAGLDVDSGAAVWPERALDKLGAVVPVSLVADTVDHRTAVTDIWLVKG